MSLPTKLKKSLGLDAQVTAVLLLRMWQIAAGAALIVLVPLTLSKSEQGYYYAFASILALQVFFELGMNQVILQMASHDFAHIKVSTAGKLEGDRTRIDRLSALTHLIRRWYQIAAAMFFLIVGIGGLLFFSNKGDLPIQQWSIAWILLTISTASNLYFSAFLTILEGCGDLAEVAKLRTHQSISGSISMWIALTLGLGLYAIAILPLMTAVSSCYWLVTKASTLKSLREHAVNSPTEIKLNWRDDIFPFQWRVALSTFSGYFIFHIFTPITFSKFGAIEAGRLGITMTLFSAILTVSMSWIYAKSPQMAAHISRDDRPHLNSLFESAVKRSMTFTVIACVAAIVISQLLPNANNPDSFAQRFASPPIFILLSVIAIANSFIYAAAAYIRAHKEEPMLTVSVVVGILTLAGATIASAKGVFAMMLTYAFITVFVGLPWTIFLFRAYWRK